MLHSEDIRIRREREDDYEPISALVKEAFATAAHSDGDEHNLICRIRETAEYIPELSLVAMSGDNLVGYIMFSRIRIGDNDALALAPLAVAPGMQGRGVGALLINSGHRIARQMGYALSVVLGDPAYYGRFGYRNASAYGITAPSGIPDEYYMVCPLMDDTAIMPGKVKYSRAFGL